MNDIASLLKEIVGAPDFTISRGTVKEVEKGKGKTCVVELHETGFVYKKVLLTLSPTNNRILLKPKVGSDVYVAEADGYEAFIVGYGELDGIKIEVNDRSLMDLISDLIDILKEATVDTPSGVGMISEATKVRLEEIEGEFNEIFEYAT